MFLLILLFCPRSYIIIPLSLFTYLIMLLWRGTLPRYRIDALVKLVWKNSFYIAATVLTALIFLLAQ